MKGVAPQLRPNPKNQTPQPCSEESEHPYNLYSDSPTVSKSPKTFLIFYIYSLVQVNKLKLNSVLQLNKYYRILVHFPC
jgi:hypothetical protein